MKAQSSFAVQGVGLFSGISRAKLFPFSIDLDRGPKTSIGAFAYAPKPSAVIGALSLIAIIISARSFPQIFSSIIEGIVILMVTLDAIPFFKPEKFSVHRNESSFSINNDLSIGVEASPPRIPVRIPSPLIQPFKIRGIDKSKLPFAKLDYAIIFKWGWHESLLESVKCASAETLTTPFYQEAIA